jgi:hypothetical protein
MSCEKNHPSGVVYQDRPTADVATNRIRNEMPDPSMIQMDKCSTCGGCYPKVVK